MAFIINTAAGSTCYDEGGITYPIEYRVNWGELGFHHCWLQLHTSRQPQIVFDDKYIEWARKFIKADGILGHMLLAVRGDLILQEDKPSPYLVKEDARYCLARAKGVSLDGRPATVGGVKLLFGLVGIKGKHSIECEFAWETIRHVICKGGQFRS